MFGYTVHRLLVSFTRLIRAVLAWVPAVFHRASPASAATPTARPPIETRAVVRLRNHTGSTNPP